MTDYIPKGNAAILDYLQNLHQQLADRPAAYGVSAADAATLGGVVSALAAATQTLKSPATRGTPFVIVRDQAQAAAVDVARSVVQRIKMDDGVTDADKNLAGVPLKRSGGGEPQPAPTFAPGIAVEAAITGGQTLRYSNPQEPGRKAKPYGIAGLQLFVHVGEEAIGDVNESQYYGTYTRPIIGVAFAPEDNKKVATYFARWIDRKGQEGPWSAPASMTIAA